MEISHSSRIDILDGVRFFAAIIVVGFHFFYSGIYSGKIAGAQYVDGLSGLMMYGYLGVEFFFLVSGYVIIRSAERHSFSDFMAGRMLRLYPAFWICVLITALFVSFFGEGALKVGFEQVLANLTMFPKLLGYEYVDGVYWTLLYELKFYFFVGLALLLGLRRHMRAFIVTWSLLIGFCDFVLDVHPPFLSGYYAYFAAGACFFVCQQRISPAGFLALSVVCLSACLFSVANAISIFSVRTSEFSVSVVLAVILVMLIFFFALMAGLIQKFRWSYLRLLGGISYPLYLLHAHIGFAAVSYFLPILGQFLAFFVAFSLVFIFSILVHVLIETRLAWLWRCLFFQFVRPVFILMEVCFNCFVKRVSSFVVAGRVK